MNSVSARSIASRCGSGSAWVRRASPTRPWSASASTGDPLRLGECVASSSVPDPTLFCVGLERAGLNVLRAVAEDLLGPDLDRVTGRPHHPTLESEPPPPLRIDDEHAERPTAGKPPAQGI